MNFVMNLPLPVKIIVGLILLFGVILGGCEWKMEADLSAAREQARKAGIAIDYKEFRKHLPVVTDEQNGAEVIKKLAALKPSRSPAEAEALKVLYKPNPTAADWATIEAIQPQLDMISTEADHLEGKTAIDFKREWELGFDVLFPEYAQIKSSIKMIGLRARLLAHRGDRLGALKELRKAFILSELTNTEPTLVAILVTIASEAICFHVLRLVIEENPLSSEEKEVVADIRKILGTPKPFGSFIHGEAAAVYMTLMKGNSNSILQLNNQDPGNAITTFFLKTSFKKVVLSDFLNSLVKLNKFASDESLSPKELFIKAQDFDQQIVTYSKNDLKKVITSSFFPLFGQVALAHAKRHAFRILIDGLLDKPITNDPFTETPMMKKTMQNGTLYYSVGVNLTDDGGDSYDAAGKLISGKDDLALFIPNK